MFSFAVHYIVEYKFNTKDISTCTVGYFENSILASSRLSQVSTLPVIGSSDWVGSKIWRVRSSRVKEKWTSGHL